MRKYTFIFWVALFSCSPSRLITKKENANLSDACKMVQTKQILSAIGLKHQARKHHRNNIKENSYAVVHFSVKKHPQNNTSERQQFIFKSKQPYDSMDVTSTLVFNKNEMNIDEVKDAVEHGTKKNEPSTKRVFRQVSHVRIIKPYPPVTKEKVKFHNGVLPMLVLGAVALLGAGLFKSTEKRFKKLSRWASDYPVAARAAIVAAQTAATVGGTALGHHLYKTGVAIPDYVYLITAAAFTVAYVSYPATYASNSVPTFSYFKRKIHDASLYMAGVAMMVYAGNHYNIGESKNVNEKIMYAASVPYSHHALVVSENNFERLPIQDNDEEPSTAGKVGLTILASFGFTLLAFLVAALSCSIACSGNEAVAAVVGIGGLGLTIWGLSAVIKNIWRKKPTSKTEPAKP